MPIHSLSWNALLRTIARGVAACLIAMAGAHAAVAQYEAVPPARTLESSSDANQWAILIGVEGYKKAPPLQFTINDVTRLGETLRTRAGYRYDNVTQFTDAGGYENRPPTRESLVAALPVIFKKMKPDDRLLVYFSGHGVRDVRDKMYLAPIDADPASIAETCIPVSWLRAQLAVCKAGFKLLVLDACHAGSEKGEDDSAIVATKDLGEPFRDLEGVITLASSSAEEKSLIWGEKEQSLFSYWFNQGLKGHADADLDGSVDVDELNAYVFRNVTHTAKTRLNRQQTPVRIVRSGAPGVPIVSKLVPVGLKELLADMADQLSWTAEDRGIERLGVLEFTSDTGLGEILGSEFGLLGKFCSSDLERRLALASTGGYSVVDQRRLQAAIAKRKFSVDGLASGDAIAQFCEAAGGLQGLITGAFQGRRGAQLSISCKLLDVKKDAVAGVAAGTARLTETDWAMLGKSGRVVVDPYAPPPRVEPGVDPADVIIPEFDRNASGPHPMRDPSFPYRLQLVVGGRPRQPVFKGNEMLVPVRQGETYELWVESRSPSPVLLQLLVDGLNTLPQKMETTKGIETFEIAPRVHLSDARTWVMDPAVSRRFSVRGFVTQTGIQGKLREFLVVDGQESVAARKNFTEQIGLVTAAFYEGVAEPGAGLTLGAAPGTGLGNERRENLAEQAKYGRGALLAVVHLRYVDADSPELRP